MTDEQILKRLAEIEGGKNFTNGRWWVRDEWTHTNLMEWNPLDDWSDLGPLIEKYQLIISPMKDGKSGEWHVGIVRPPMSFHEYFSHESLPHAICLAIIEANGGMGDE